MDKKEIIKGLKIATNKIGGCSDVGGWLSDDESEARYVCEQVIKGLENGAIILRAEDKCTTAENNRFVEMIEKDAYERNIPFKEAFCNRNRQLIVQELEEIKDKIEWEAKGQTDAFIKAYKVFDIIDKHIAELKGE